MNEMNSYKNNYVIIEGTHFIFKTNFSGDADRDTFGSTQRKGNIVIPNVDQARQLIDEGFNVKMTKPRPGEEEGFIPRYYVAIKVNYDTEWPPKIYLMTSPTEGVLLDSESVNSIDYMWVDNVNVVLNKYDGKNGKSLWVKSMEVFQKLDDDPITARHVSRIMTKHEDSDDDGYLPFD